MRFRTLYVAAIAAALSATSSFAFAEDWVATKLRGPVMLHVDGHWTKLERGAAVPELSVIRTLRGGRVTFQRGGESIEVGGDTQIHIRDRAGQQFTTVHQFFGKVEVEAEARDVQHFAVQTPYLAAVVKGTRFTVVSGEGGAKVSVQRGHVAVEDGDTHQSTLLSVGQSAETSASEGAPLAVEGNEDLPAILDASGKPVSTTPKDASNQARAAALEAGATPKAAERAAREAARETAMQIREERNEEGKASRGAAKESREAAKGAGKEGRSESPGGNNGGNGGGRGNSGDSGGGGRGNSGDGGGPGTSGDGGGNGAGHSDNSGGGNSGGNGGGNGASGGSDNSGSGGGNGGGGGNSGGGGNGDGGGKKD